MRLESKSIRLRLIESADAEFILKLRVDERYNQFLSAVTPNIEMQREWIASYKNDEHKKLQYYFIIERNDGTPCGTVRLYDFKGDSFTWGSWILNEEKTPYSALESAFLVYRFAFDILKLNKSHFEVRKGNSKVVSFHQKMGAVQTGENDIELFFEITKEAVAVTRSKLSSKIS